MSSSLSPLAAATPKRQQQQLAPPPQHTTYQYGIRPGMDRFLREIEQGGRSNTALLVTRGHVELEVFTEASSNADSVCGPPHGGPVGTYNTPAHTRPSLSSRDTPIR